MDLPPESPESPDSPARRDLLTAFAGAAALGILPKAAFAQGAASTAAAAPAGALMSWAEYVDLLKPAADLIDKTFEPHSDQVRLELYRQLVMNISQGYFMYFGTDPEYPDWMPFENSVFMLQPNPDGVYHYASVDGRGVYRVTGERGSNRVMGFAIGKHMIGVADPPGPGYNNYDADKFTLGKEGAFDVIFSADRPKGHKGDWRYLHPESEFIMIRQFSYDWGKEREARFTIERLDKTGLKPRPSKEQISETLKALLGGYARRLSNLAIDTDNEVQNRGIVNKLEFSHFMGNSPEWPQIYWRGNYDIRDGEALILETELPKQCHYWNVQINDALWNQVEFVYRQSSLNGHQARVDSDGKFRAVLSLEDPGIHNWLDSGGFHQGMLIGRWHRYSSSPMPTLKKVALADVHKLLPANTPSITPEERAASLRKRKLGAQLRRRW